MLGPTRLIGRCKVPFQMLSWYMTGRVTATVCTCYHDPPFLDECQGMAWLQPVAAHGVDDIDMTDSDQADGDQTGSRHCS